MKKFLSASFLKYLAVGVSSVILDFISLIILKSFFTNSAALATSINQILLWFYNFNLNKHWTFNNKNLPYRQLVRYLMLAGFNYLLSVALMYVLSDLAGFNYLLVRFSLIACMTLWNFLLYKHWVYKGPVANSRIQSKSQNFGNFFKKFFR